MKKRVCKMAAIALCLTMTAGMFAGCAKEEKGELNLYTWDGMFPRVQSGTEDLDYTIKGLRFVGGHGTQMDGYSQAYLSGAEQARYMLNDIKEGK